jgi:hypothetical protein
VTDQSTRQTMFRVDHDDAANLEQKMRLEHRSKLTMMTWSTWNGVQDAFFVPSWPRRRGQLRTWFDASIDRSLG